MEKMKILCLICNEEIEFSDTNSEWEISNLIADHTEHCYMEISGSKKGWIDQESMMQIDYLMGGHFRRIKRSKEIKLENEGLEILKEIFNGI